MKDLRDLNKGDPRAWQRLLAGREMAARGLAVRVSREMRTTGGKVFSVGTERLIDSPQSTKKVLEPRTSLSTP